MDLASVQWTAVVACFVFSVVSGALWFAPKTFFPAWWQAIGKAAGDQPVGTPATWVLLMLTSVAQALGAALLVPLIANAMGGLTVTSGVTAGAFIWLGFVGSSGLANKLFAGYVKAWMIESGNHLLNYAVFGAIIGALR
jgi:hypothetical protein